MFALRASHSVGPVAFQKLIEKYGSASLAIDALLDGPNAHKVRKPEDAAREIEQAQKLGMNILYLSSDNYPARLAAIYDAPPLLYWKGNAELFHRRACAIVGARNASGAGLKLTRKIAGELGTANITVVFRTCAWH